MNTSLPIRQALISSLFLLSCYTAHAQFALEWRDGLVGSGQVSVQEIDEDPAGNTYVVGQLTGTIDFDPGAGVANRTATGNIDGFLAKYDVNGNFLWANVFQTPFSGWTTMPFQIKVAQNSVFIGGTFIGTVDFDPGPGVANVTAVGGLGPFFGRYDLNGNYMWVKTVGTLNNDHVTGLDVDAAGNVYVAFVSGGTSPDFDPGPGVAAVPINWNDGVFAKYDINGNYIFAKTFRSTAGNWHPAMDISVDNANNIYVTGTFESTIDIDPDAGVINLPSAGGVDGYIAKFNSTGNYLWHGQYSGTGNEVGVCIKTDLTDNSVYCGGSFSSAMVDMNIGPGTANINVNAADNGFLAKYSTTGNYLWSVNVNGNGSEGVSDIDLDACQNVYATGNFNSSSMDLDPSAAVASFTSNGAEDFFLTKYTSAGAYIYALAQGGPGSDVSAAVSMNPFNGRVSLVGTFNQTVDFDPGPGSATLTASGANDGYIVSYSESPPQPVDLTPAPNLSVCPGDSTMLIVSGSASGTVYWYDSTGALVGTGDTLYTGPVFGTTIFIFKDSIFCLPASTPDTITINVGSINVSITAADTSLCLGDSVTLNGAGAASFVWAPGGSTASSITVSPASTTTYTLAGQTAGCFDTTSITIYVYPLPGLGMVATDDTICTGETVTITASGATSFSWTPGGYNTAAITVTPGISTLYVVTGSNGSCSATDTFALHVWPSPVLSLGTDLSVCDTASVVLTPNVAAGTGPFSYVWNDMSTNPTLPVANPGTYFVKVTDVNSCTDADTIVVSITPMPNVNFQAGPNPICYGQSATITASGATSYFWLPGGTTNNAITVAPTSTTTYTVTGTNGICSASNTYTLQVSPLPVMSLGADLVVCDTGATIVPDILSGVAPYTYIWSDMTTGPTLSILSPGTYFLVLTDANNCTVSDTLELIRNCPPTIYIPSAFSPNGDGFNPLFMAVGTNIETFRMEIFNRWGQLIKRIDDINVGWDGTYANEQAPQAVYVYRVTYRDMNSSEEHVLIGGFSLLR